MEAKSSHRLQNQHRQQQARIADGIHIFTLQVFGNIIHYAHFPACFRFSQVKPSMIIDTATIILQLGQETE